MEQLATAFFTAIGEIASLVPEFDERKKSMIQKKQSALELAQTTFHDYAVGFSIGDSTEVLQGLAENVGRKTKELQELYILYSKEIKGEA